MLTDNQETILRFILAHPDTTTGPIIAATGIANSRVYASLQELSSLGVLSQARSTSGTLYRVASLRPLQEAAREQHEDALRQIEELARNEAPAPQPTPTVYQGHRGFSAAFHDIIDSAPRESIIRIHGFSAEDYAADALRVVLKNLNLRSQEKHQELRILLAVHVRDTLGADRRKEPNAVVRFIADALASPIATDITETDVWLLHWRRDPYAIRIPSQDLAEAYARQFDVLWRQAVP